MRTYSSPGTWFPALLGVASLLGCGGATSSIGGDASVDGASESGSGSGSGGGSGGSSGSGSGSGSSSGSSSGGGNCPSCSSAGGLICCDGVTCSVDPFNDPKNCGSCGHECTAPATFCGKGTCEPPPCSTGTTCAGTGTCCGSSCCDGAQICYQFEGPVDTLPSCFTPTSSQPSCPAGCLTCVSDRNLKRDIEPVDPQAVLEGIARVPVATWSYKADDPSVRHMGPMAQDFYGEFELGNTDKTYNSIDAHGVAFAAIQALYERMREQDARIEKLERENAQLRRGLRR